jgi:hypothetical protein
MDATHWRLEVFYMKKSIALVLFAIIFAAVFSAGALAAARAVETVDYYDANGNKITVNGMYYNTQGHPMFNANCQYLDVSGNLVYVGGSRVYYYKADGDFAPGKYYYDADGRAVPRPSSYPGGWGCGTYCYDSRGNIVRGTYYYDDFGNPISPPAVQAIPPSYCGGRGRLMR